MIATVLLVVAACAVTAGVVLVAGVGAALIVGGCLLAALTYLLADAGQDDGAA